MKIAIPISDDCISPVFDFAHRLVLVNVKDGREINRTEVALASKSLFLGAGTLRDLEVDVLICGAISRSLFKTVVANRIDVLAYVTGPLEEVLKAYSTNKLADNKFVLPGRYNGARKGFERRR